MSDGQVVDFVYKGLRDVRFCARYYITTDRMEFSYSKAGWLNFDRDDYGGTVFHTWTVREMLSGPRLFVLARMKTRIGDLSSGTTTREESEVSNIFFSWASSIRSILRTIEANKSERVRQLEKELSVLRSRARVRLEPGYFR